MMKEKKTSRLIPTLSVELKAQYRKAGSALERSRSQALSFFPLHRAYRHTALYLKLFIITSLFSSVISNVYAESTLERVGSVWRLKGPPGNLPELRIERTRKRVASCPRGRALSDLVMRFPSKKDADPWIALNILNKGPCETIAYPTSTGYELRLSYPSRETGILKKIAYQTNTSWVIDHWFAAKPKPKQDVTEVDKETMIPGSGRMNNPLLDLNQELVSLYEDQDSWAKILGDQGTVYSFDTPELERFRTEARSRHKRFVEKDVTTVPLKIPLIDLPLLDAQLQFQETELELGLFQERDLDSKGVKKMTNREKQALVDGLNYFRLLTKEEKWLEARESLRILETGNLKHGLPKDTALWWAVKGLINIRLAEKLDDDAVYQRGLDYWRDGLQRVAGRGGPEQQYSSFMLLESLRRLFENDQYYAAAATLAWSQRVRWGPETEERLAYLRAEAHYRLGLFEESRELFWEFTNSRKDLPLSAAFDRRLLPLAYFRLGDVLLRTSRYAEAVKEYSRVFSEIPSSEKISFEGAWYPVEVRYYPQALYHRAEAALRLGDEVNALADLRAFIHFALDHPNATLVFFRIGDLLESMGASDEKIDGTWRECLFRSAEDVGNKLCGARQAIRRIKKDEPNRWPRLVAAVEGISKASDLHKFSATFNSDLKAYQGIILAHAFLKIDEPFQAYDQIRRPKLSDVSPQLVSWAKEYEVSGLAGYLQTVLARKEYKKVIELYSQSYREKKIAYLRSEVQWPLVQAYSEMGLISLAKKQSELSRVYAETHKTHPTRPYLPSESDWVFKRLDVEVALFEAEQRDSSEVDRLMAAAQKVSGRERDKLRIAVRIAAVKGDREQEIRHWNSLRKVDVLSWRDIARMSDLLKAEKNNGARMELLEANVGAWLSVAASRRPQPAPQPSLIYDLFEARDKSKKWGPAYAALEFLAAMEAEQLAPNLTKAQILFQQGKVQREMGRQADARQSFEGARDLAPESLWGQLSVSELKTF